MQELRAAEIAQVGGGFIPAAQGVVYGLGLAARSPAGRAAISWVGQGIVGGAAWSFAQEIWGGGS